MRPPPHTSVHKIVITGTGRAGTTFLVQLLTKLGLDTGYTPETLQRDYYPHCAAGLEHDLEAPDSPYIVKSPLLCESLPGIMQRGAIVIDHALIPIRALDDAAKSRIRVGGEGQTPGGLWGTSDADRQKAVLAENFHRLVHTLTVHEIPHTFLDFPRFAQDPDYTYEKLRCLLGDLPREKFVSIFNATARTELIHSFPEKSSESDGAPARAFAEEAVRKRRHRRAKRLIGAGALAAIIWTGVGWNSSPQSDDALAADAVATQPPTSPSPLWLLSRHAWFDQPAGIPGRVSHIHHFSPADSRH